MHTEKQSTHICRNCRYYSAHYEKYPAYFVRQRTGRCSMLQKAVRNNGSCALYKYRPYKEKTVTPEQIDIVIADIQEIEKLLISDNSQTSRKLYPKLQLW